MADEQPKQENEVTPQGAIEVDEQDLDQAAGGGSDLPMETVSLNYSKIELDAARKGTPDIIVATGPGGGPHVAPEKKL